MLADFAEWVDRESGVAGAVIVNVVPHGDAVLSQMYDELERVVYADLVPGKG